MESERAIKEIIDMYPLTVNGLKAGIKQLMSDNKNNRQLKLNKMIINSVLDIFLESVLDINIYLLSFFLCKIYYKLLKKTFLFVYISLWIKVNETICQNLLKNMGLTKGL